MAPITVSESLLNRFNMDVASFLTYIENLSKNTLLETLNMSYVEVSEDKLVMAMPVTSKVHQPMGLLHGGASIALAETVASMATVLNIDTEIHTCVGLEINANHIRSLREGVVTATATPLHKGRKTMVWDIKLTDESGKLVCVSRCTMAVLDR